jgi:hypothetical protein
MKITSRFGTVATATECRAKSDAASPPFGNFVIVRKKTILSLRRKRSQLLHHDLAIDRALRLKLFERNALDKRPCLYSRRRRCRFRGFRFRTAAGQRRVPFAAYREGS